MSNLLPNSLAVLALIRDDGFCRRELGNQGGGLGAVIDLSTRDFKRDGQTLSVHRQVNLAGITGSTFPYSLIAATGGTGTVLVSLA